MLSGRTIEVPAKGLTIPKVRRRVERYAKPPF
jgi:hypothetical protein